MDIEKLLKEMDAEFSQHGADHEIGYFGWRLEVDYYYFRQWLANKLQKAIVSGSLPLEQLYECGQCKQFFEPDESGK